MVSSAPAILTTKSWPIPPIPQKKVSQSPLKTPDYKAAKALMQAGEKSPFRLVRQINIEQKKLQSGQHSFIDGVCVRNHSFYLLDAHIGGGSFNDVYSTRAFRHPQNSTPKGKKLALRVSKTARKEIVPVEKLVKNTQGLDICLDRSTDKEGEVTSSHPLYQGTLKDVRWTGSDSIRFYVDCLKNIAVGLKNLHDTNIIHRDIKGENCLVDSKKPAVLTDFDDIKGDSEEPRKIFGTFLYLDPAAFTSLASQIQWTGIQTKATDLYAFGRMIEFDILLFMLQDMGQKYAIETSEFIQVIEPVLLSPEKEKFFSPEQIKEIDQQYPLGAIIAPSQGGFDFAVFNPVSKRLKAMRNGFDALKKQLPSCDYEAVLSLAKLASDLQHPEPKSRPKVEGLITSLFEIHISYENKKRERSYDSSLYKAAKRVKLTFENPSL